MYVLAFPRQMEFGIDFENGLRMYVLGDSTEWKSYLYIDFPERDVEGMLTGSYKHEARTIDQWKFSVIQQYGNQNPEDCMFEDFEITQLFKRKVESVDFRALLKYADDQLMIGKNVYDTDFERHEFNTAASILFMYRTLFDEYMATLEEPPLVS